MMKRRLLSLLFFAGLISLSLFVAAVVRAQTDDKPELDTPSVTPDSPPVVGWSQIELPPHDPAAALAVIPAPETGANPASENPPPAAAWTAYVVQAGDTLFRVAHRFQISVSALAAENQIANPSRIRVGQVLHIPDQNSPGAPPPAVPAPSPAPSGNVYTVQPGDTLSRIARRFGVSLNDLAAANGIVNRSFIRAGQQLKIPGAVPPPSPAEPPPAEGTTYIVQRGDTLFLIARRFGVTISALAAGNQIANPSLIYPGQALIIGVPVNNPAPPPAEPPSPAPFIWPVESRRIVQYAHAGHQAIDIALPAGSPVYATAGGKIEFAGWNQYGYGNLVVVDHGNGWRTLYAHNSAFQVKTGDAVVQGEVIALSGSTGNSTMPHVHLEMMLNLGAVNPCLYLPGGC